MTDEHASHEPASDADGGDRVVAAEEVTEAEVSEDQIADEVLEGEVLDAEIVDDDVVEGEVVEPTGTEAAMSDALLAEALDAEAIEAQFVAAEKTLAGADVGAELASLTADLQRVHAEYANYRKRVDRDRELIRERAVETVLVEFLPILDDVGRARDHGELLGGFRSVGDALEAVVARLGMVAFGEVGEAFDPTRHEALMREEREGVTEPTVVNVLAVGYLMGGRVVRPARVSVAGTD